MGGSPDDQFLDPMAVMRTASAYWNSSILHVAHALGVFTKIGDGSKDVKTLAELCGADVRGVEMILMGCVGLGFLSRDGDQFSNTPLSKTFLVEGSPRYQGGIVGMFSEWVLPWSKLNDAVKNGAPVVEKQHDKGDEATRAYIMGMLYRGIPQAELLAKEVPLPNSTRLLDVGGGPGIFSIIFCQENPQLNATVFDLPQTLKITKEIIGRYNADRVTTHEGSYLEDEFGSGYDVVLLSSMINQEGPEVVKEIMRKSFDAMESGGRILMQEQLLDDDRTGPLLAVQIGLNQLIHTPAGRAYSGKEIADLAREVGFTDLKYRPLPEPSPFTLVEGIKP